MTRIDAQNNMIFVGHAICGAFYKRDGFVLHDGGGSFDYSEGSLTTVCAYGLTEYEEELRWVIEACPKWRGGIDCLVCRQAGRWRYCGKGPRNRDVDIILHGFCEQNY